MGHDEPPGDRPQIRVTVPARDDFVSVLRVTARVVAGRAGCSDDARSRLQAAVGGAFFALLESGVALTAVRVVLWPEGHQVTAELTPDDPAGLTGIDARGPLGDGHELVDGGRTLRLWITD